MKMRCVLVVMLLLGTVTPVFAQHNHIMPTHMPNMVTGKDVPDAEAYSLWLATVKANPDVIRRINLSEPDLETLKRHVEEYAVLYAQHVAEQREAAMSNPANSPEGFAEKRLALATNRILLLRNDLSAEGFATVNAVVQAAKQHMFAPMASSSATCFDQMCLNYSGSLTWSVSSDYSTLTSSLTVQGNSTYSNCQPCGEATHQVVGEHAWVTKSTGAFVGGTLNMNGEKVSPPSVEINYTDNQSIAMDDICDDDPVDCDDEEDDDPSIDCSVAGDLPAIFISLPNFGWKIEATVTTSVSTTTTNGNYIYTLKDYCDPTGVMFVGLNAANQLADPDKTDYEFILQGFCIQFNGDPNGWGCLPPPGGTWPMARVLDKLGPGYEPYTQCSTD